MMTEQIKPNLRTLLQDHKAKARKSAMVRIPWTVDGDLADQFDELTYRRQVVVAKHAQARARLTGDDTEDERASGTRPDVAAIDESEKTELVDLDARIAEVKRAGDDATVMLVFKALTATRYTEVYNTAVDSSEDKAEQWDEFSRALVRACFVGAEQSGVMDTSIVWAEIVDATDEDGSPLLPFGQVDAIQSMVYAANRNTVDTPFLSRPSVKTR